MGLAYINKLSIIGLLNDKELLLETLQKSGAVHLEDVSHLLNIPAEEKAFMESPFSSIPHLNEQIANLDFAIQFISSFETKKGGLFGERPVFSFKEIAEQAESGYWETIVGKCKSIDRSFREISAQIARLSAENALLKSWLAFDVSFEEAFSTRICQLALGSLSFDDLENLKKTIGGIPEADIKIVHSDDEKAHIAVFYLKEAEGTILSALKSNNFQETRFRELKGTPAENIKKLDEAIASLREKEEKFQEEAKALVPERLRLMAINDYFVLKRARNDVLVNAMASRKTIFISGWIAKRDIEKLKSLLNSSGLICEFSIFEPEPEDNPPIIFENKQPARPFEVITKIYGMPQKMEIDPTPIFTPFFLIFFGFCLTDAGYGLFILAIAVWALWKFKPSGDGRQMLQILLLGAVSTVILGALCGGWFGNAPSMLAEKFPGFFAQIETSLRKIGSLDPMANSENAIRLMLIALSLGVIQVLSGNIAGFINSVKISSIRDALMDQGSILMLLTGILILVVSGVGILPQGTEKIGIGMASLGTLSIVIFGGRSAPTFGFKVFNGFFSAYNAWAGFLSDVLSYSRLWGLGLVTGVMATTVNIIAKEMGKLTWNIPFVGPVIGIIIGAIIIIAGHLFSIAINVLGAFIHSTRLQFVEFFSKFFRGGGRAFEPFEVKTKYVSLKD